MRTTGQRMGITALTVLLCCLGLFGCLNTQDDFTPIMQPTAMSPASLRAGSGSATAQANAGGLYQAPTSGSLATRLDPGRSQVQQTAYRPPAATLAQAGTAQAPANDTPVPRLAPNGGLGSPDIGLTPPLEDHGGLPPPPGPDGGHRPMPNELVPVSHPPYRVAPPDILLINALRVVPRGPYRLEPLEVLSVNVTDTLKNEPISGPFMISPEGTINLGYNYGSVRVGGLSLDQAQQAIFNHLSSILKNPNVNLAVTQFRGLQQIAGQHLVRPDGTISMGTYGSVYVAGLTLGQVKCVLEKYLSEYLVNPQLSVDMLAYNSQKIYVIFDGGGFGQRVIPLPVTGNETVLDAISSLGGLATVSSKKRIWVARPSPCNLNCNIILPVDWNAITMNGQTCTNYQLFPQDRVYISANRLIMFDNYLAQVLSPIERIFGAVLLGNFTVRSFQSSNGSNGGTNAGLFVP